MVGEDSCLATLVNWDGLVGGCVVSEMGMEGAAGVGGWDKVWKRWAPPHAVLWLLLGRGLAIGDSRGPGPGAMSFGFWAEAAAADPLLPCRLPGMAAAVCPPEPGNASAGRRCQARDSGGDIWFWIPRDRRVTTRVQGLAGQDGRTLRWEDEVPWSHNSDAKAFQSRGWGRKAGFVGGA